MWYGKKMEDLKLGFGSMDARKIQFIPMSGNKAAHILANLALYFVAEKVWIEDGSLEVMHCIELEKFV